jgi:serine/threonine-protein kinase
MILYEMFTGELPFHEIENPMEMLALRATTPPPKPSTIQPEITPELEAVILKAFALKPEDRYESGAALATALEKSLPLVEIIAIETADDLTQAVTPDREEGQAAPLFMTSPAAEAALSPPTAVPGPPPVQAPNSASSSQRKFAGLPIPVIAVGGCLVLLLLAVLMVGGGIQLIRGQLADGYETWIPITIKGNQEPSSGEETEPSLPEIGATGSAEGRSLLRIATNGDDSFYLINVGSSAVPLSGFQFDDGRRSFEGSSWGIPLLAHGECVSIWKDKGHPGAPAVDCNEVGNRVEVKANETFWKDEFSISFQDIVVTTCPNEGCEFSVPNEQ